MKEQIETLLEKLSSREQSQRSSALSDLKNLISSSTSSITSVPKPLKWLSPHYESLKTQFEEQTDSAVKVSPAIITNCFLDCIL